MAKPQIRSRFNRPERVKAKVEGESMTKQSFERASNVNNIMKKAVESGMPPTTGIGNPLARREMHFGEMTSVDLHEAMNKVMDTENQFRALPSRVRSRFKNAYQLLRWLEDPRNEAEAVRLGLIENEELRDRLQDLEAQADAQARQAAESSSRMVRADEEANPRPASRKANPDPTGGHQGA